MTENRKQDAAVQLQMALAHLSAATIYWNPGLGLRPREETESDEVKSWHKLLEIEEKLKQFMSDEGP